MQLFRRIPQILRTSVNSCQRQSSLSRLRLFSSSPADDEFAGLTLSSPKVKRFLETVRLEYEDLSRTEQRDRAGHRRLATLTPLIKILAERSSILENLQQLQTEMKAERDKELLALIEEEKIVCGLEC